MERLESTAWPLACGSFCVFALAVVLKEADWRIAFALLLVTATAWSASAPWPARAALGTIAWILLTTFDINKTGTLTGPSPTDLTRAAVLITACLAVGLTRKRRRMVTVTRPSTKTTHREPSPFLAGRAE